MDITPLIHPNHSKSESGGAKDNDGSGSIDFVSVFEKGSEWVSNAVDINTNKRNKMDITYLPNIL